jgi:diguanylate cyclase (GGDEF)-like protein
MGESIGTNKPAPENPALQDDIIVGEVNDVIADLLKNVIKEMQNSEINKQLGDESQASSSSGDKIALQSEMDIAVIRQVTSALQKFLDNANLMMAKLEGVDNDYDHKADSFMDNYIATADSILEVAAFSTKDSLTGLSNKYGFDNRLVLEWNRATREQTPLCLLLFDIQDLSAKDSDSKNKALVAIARTIEKTIKRSTDFVARWNDDEFAALLPITGNDGAKIVAERILTEIGNIDFPTDIETTKKISVCIGVSVQVPTQSEHATDFVTKTQTALNKAKESGHNTIVFI